MALIFAAVNKIAGNKDYIGILIFYDLFKAGVDYCGGFGNAFLVRSAAALIRRTACAERGVVIMRVRNKIKSKLRYISHPFTKKAQQGKRPAAPNRFIYFCA